MHYLYISLPVLFFQCSTSGPGRERHDHGHGGRRALRPVEVLLGLGVNTNAVHHVDTRRIQTWTDCKWVQAILIKKKSQITLIPRLPYLHNASFKNLTNVLKLLPVLDSSQLFKTVNTIYLQAAIELNFPFLTTASLYTPLVMYAITVTII